MLFQKGRLTHSFCRRRAGGEFSVREICSERLAGLSAFAETSATIL
jgi:hypothetical protein